MGGECVHSIVTHRFAGRCASQQDEGNGGERKDHHQFEIVDVADNRSLRLYDLIEARPLAVQGLAAADGVVKGMIECRDMAGDGD
jgi:hypothetical protein